MDRRYGVRGFEVRWSQAVFLRPQAAKPNRPVAKRRSEAGSGTGLGLCHVPVQREVIQKVLCLLTRAISVAQGNYPEIPHKLESESGSVKRAGTELFLSAHRARFKTNGSVSDS